MKKMILSMMMAVLIMTFIPVTGFASLTTTSGTIQGYTCVTEGTTCPVGEHDPLTSAVRTFVLLTASNHYYFIPNVDRAALKNLVNQDVRISGKIDPKYRAIEAWQIDEKEKGHWDKVWGTPTVEEIARAPWKYF